MAYHFRLFALFTLYVARTAKSFPNGAGGCAGDMAAVGGYHLDKSNNRTVSTNTLAAGGVDVRIGDVLLDPNAVADFATGQNHTVTVETTQFPIRGTLIRLQAPEGIDTTAALTPGMLMQAAKACVPSFPVVGTTHTDSSDKTALMSTIRFDDAAKSVILDVTVVFINGPAGSVYLYSRYLVNFNAANVSASPTLSPVKGPAPKAPVAVETLPPSTAAPMVLRPDTLAPTIPPTSKPSTAPTQLSVTIAPSLNKSDAPSGGPTSTRSEPTKGPALRRTDVPAALADAGGGKMSKGGNIGGKGGGGGGGGSAATPSAGTPNPPTLLPTKQPSTSKGVKGKMSKGAPKETVKKTKRMKKEKEEGKSANSMQKLMKNAMNSGSIRA